MSWSPKERISRGRLKITENIWFYKCHFTDEGMMPGVLQTETMLQTIVASLCYEYSINAKNCLINKTSSDFFNKIQGPGYIDTFAEISEENNGLVSAKAKLNFNDTKISAGSFRFILPSNFKPTSL